jgi:hypothetical protein
MAIRDEGSASAELKRDAVFHKAALLADKAAEHLAASVQSVIARLKTAVDAAEAAESERVVALARLSRADFELDDRLRLLELDLQKETNKNRKDPLFRAVLPDGLSPIVALRGARQHEQVIRIAKALEKRSPELAKAYSKELVRLSKAAVDAETAWRSASTDAVAAFGDEVLARTELVRQLQKNEGALLALFPGQRRRVRSFYRPTRRRGAAPDDGTPETERIDG